MILDSAQKRRSRYQLTPKLPISDDKLIELVQQSIKVAPSAFNSQSTRAVILLKEKHYTFWQIARSELQKIVPAEKFGPTEEKLKSFENAYGTILFFEEWKTVEALQNQFPTYKDNFPLWAYQANAMAEFIIWTALAEQGIGASLQHYNPLVDARVKETFNLPASWKLIAQMPFGVSVGVDAPKTFLRVDERVKVMK